MMTIDSPTATFSLVPRGPFSLRLAAGHAFGPRMDARDSDRMRLAFCVDGFRALAGVVLRQDPDGTVTGELLSDAPVEVVRAQVARILSLDHDGAGWPGVGERDPVLGRIQARFPGFRPVLFASPYEAAAWPDRGGPGGGALFFASLILTRAAGPADVLAPEPRLLDCAARYYGPEAADPARLGELAEAWRPYRTWATVAMRRAGYEDGIG